MSIIADKCRPKLKQRQFARAPINGLAHFCGLPGAITAGFAARLGNYASGKRTAAALILK